jgi:hypothetical protein
MIITKILKPEKFNAETFAHLCWPDSPPSPFMIDAMQRILDGLLAEGVIE